MMLDAIFHNSYPPRWRIILRCLTFTSIVLIGSALLISVYFMSQGEDLMPSYLVLASLIPMYAAILLRSAVSETSSDATKTAFASTIFICVMVLILAILFIFEQFKKIDRKMETQWVVSEACSEDGAFRTEILPECLLLKSHFRTSVCLFGADPMKPCEADLRDRLNRPKTPEPELVVVE